MKTSLFFAAVLFFVVTVLAGAQTEELLIEYKPDMDARLRAIWNEPPETDIAGYTVHYREISPAPTENFIDQFYPISAVQYGDQGQWSVTGTFEMIAPAIGDTTRYEFRLSATDYALNVSEKSAPVFVALYFPDTTPPGQPIGFVLTIEFLPRTN